MLRPFLLVSPSYLFINTGSLIIKFLEYLPNDCNINLISNGNVDFNTNKVFNALSQKNNVVWELSFDNVKEKFEYVRHGGKWDLLVENIKKYRYSHIILENIPKWITGKFRKHIVESKTKVILPLFHQNHMLGVLCVGKKFMGEEYSNTDIKNTSIQHTNKN